MTIMNVRFALDPQDLTVESTTQLYGIGELASIAGNSDGTNSVYIYCLSHGALTAYVPYEIYHNGTTLITRAPVTGAGLIVVPQVAVDSGAYFWGLIKGNGTCAVKQETYAAGDQLEVLTTGVLANVDGTSGATVRTVNSFAVSKATGTAAANISVYLYGNDVTDIAGS